MVLHESQSRLWENLVCRSRPFWQFFFPGCRICPRAARRRGRRGVCWRSVNRVQPSFIRVEADEITYGMHIILRYELEQEIISRPPRPSRPARGLEREDEGLPRRRRPRRRHGVLQDVHWSGGSFGYFPTYFLGTIASAADLGELRGETCPILTPQMEAGEFAPLREWLGDNLSLGPALHAERDAGADRRRPARRGAVCRLPEVEGGGDLRREGLGQQGEAAVDDQRLAADHLRAG